MNNSITQAVFFTVRGIERREVFAGLLPSPSKALVDFFMSRNDELSQWLNEQVEGHLEQEEASDIPIEQYRNVPDNVKANADAFEGNYGRVYSEDSTLAESIENAENMADLQAIKASFLSIYDDLSAEEQNKWEALLQFMSLIPDLANSELRKGLEPHSFTIDDYRVFANLSLGAIVTHCDKESPLVRDRLGWYHKEDGQEGNTVACAVYPWVGETDKEHNTKWASALITTMLNEYPSLKDIILVCHDRDFSGFSGVDDVVKEGLFKDIKAAFPQLYSLIVFQHSNKTIMGALNKSKAAEVFDAIKTYSDGYSKLQKADENNENAKAHGLYHSTPLKDN